MRLIPALFLLAAAPLAAQSALQPIIIDPATAQQHVLPHPGPSIPPIALAAHVFADVVTQVGIDPNGHVVWVVAISGPPMLIGAGIEDSLNLLFTPFTQNGQPVYATALVKTTYGPSTPTHDKREILAWQNSSPLPSALFECNQANNGKNDAEQIAKHCKAIVAAADKTTGDTYPDRRINAYLRVSGVFYNNMQFDDALATANKAVALATPGHIDEATLALAYAGRAQAEFALKNASAADADLTQAEQAERAAIAIIQSDYIKKHYTTTLEGFLNRHATVLNSMGNAQAAQAKSDEAATLANLRPQPPLDAHDTINLRSETPAGPVPAFAF